MTRITIGRLSWALLGAIGALLLAPGTALADYTASPSPTTIVQGAGSDTAFTGSDPIAAVLIGVFLAAAGAAALLAARHVARRS